MEDPLQAASLVTQQGEGEVNHHIFQWKEVAIISIIVSRHWRGIATRICSWVLRIVVARARLVTGRWMWRPTHSVIIYFTPVNRRQWIIAVVRISQRRHRPSRQRIIVWVTGIMGRGQITSRGILFMIRGILTTVGSCIIVSCSLRLHVTIMHVTIRCGPVSRLVSPPLSLPTALPLHCPLSIQLPIQTGLTHCRSVLVGTVVVPHFPICAVASWTSSSLPSLCRHCFTHPARYPTQTGLIHCRSVLVGSIVAPHYPFSVLMALRTSCTSLSLCCHCWLLHPLWSLDFIVSLTFGA